MSASSPLARVRARWRRGWSTRVRVRPTQSGWWFLVTLVGLAVASFNTGNNLFYLVLSLMLAMLVVQNVLAEWNMRGVIVRRVLPDEAFAHEAAFGAFELYNQRRAFTSLDLELEELDGGEARALVAVLPPGETLRAPGAYTFAGRGWNRLGRIRLRSDFPFGLFMRSRDFTIAAEILVYPARRTGEVGAAPRVGGHEELAEGRRGDAGGYFGMRPYEAGDPTRLIHAPTSARMGEPMVLQRLAEEARSALLRPTGDEASLSQACGEAVRRLHRGQRVGLELGGLRLEPDAGAGHRRRLLSALALHREGR